MVIINELKKAEAILRDLEKFIQSKNHKVHKNNEFNRRFSGTLDCFTDFYTIGMRLEKSIKKNIKLNRKIRERFDKEDRYKIDTKGQKLRRKERKMALENKVDFKSLYIFARIFLDEYTKLINFIFDWSIKKDTIAGFYHMLLNYKGEKQSITTFKKECFKELKAIDIFITEYRNDYVVHQKNKHEVNNIFLQETNGDIRFIGGRPSIVPSELVFIVNNLLKSTYSFIKNNF